MSIKNLVWFQGNIRREIRKADKKVIARDENAAYYLMGGGDPALRSSGATSPLMWKAIKFSSSVTRTFDFEGSMINRLKDISGLSEQDRHHTLYEQEDEGRKNGQNIV